MYLYLLPLGTGNTKGDNYHGWGSPTGSFWCCYGTAVESFAKLADSIYFQEAAAGQQPVLYVNQYVSSKVSWAAAGVGLVMRATYFGAGRQSTAAAVPVCVRRAPDRSEQRRCDPCCTRAA